MSDRRAVAEAYKTVIAQLDRAIHMWTAPGPQEVVQRADRIACDHMSGLLMRSHMTAAKMGFAT
jgi:hypothetical protein